MERLNIEDCKRFIKGDEMTKPFLDNDFVLEKVMKDFNHKAAMGEKASKISSLMGWIKANVKYAEDESFRAENKFARNSQEIWESKLATGCTDYALLFATFARQIGIPTTLLHTAERGWVERLKTGADYNIHKGHTFCECFYENEWILVDPTFRKVEKNYNPKMLELSYIVGDSNVYVPYLRTTDFDTEQNVLKFNKKMEELCKNL